MDVFVYFRSIRWYVSADMTFFRDSEVGLQRTDGRFHTSMQTAGDIVDLDIDEIQTDLEGQLDRFTNLGSGWSLLEIKRFTIHIAQYRPLAGSSYIETPKAIVGKQAIVNVRNLHDNECFRWAILSAMFPATVHVERVSLISIGTWLMSLNGMDSEFM